MNPGIYDVSRLVKGVVDELEIIDFLEPKSEAFEKFQMTIKTPVNMKAALYRTNLGIVLKGKAEVETEVECARCLARFIWLIRFELDEMFLNEGQSKENTDADSFYIEGQKIDVNPAIVQSILLSVPLKPLCREDCKGLCQRCGQDLNRLECGCKKETYDVRWEALKKYKNDKLS